MAIKLSNEEEILFADLLGKSREFLIARPEILADPGKFLNRGQLKKFRAARKKLRAGLPVAYLLGYKWFYGEKFKVTPAVLIPRPETELLVERGLEIAKTWKPQTIIDIGTGSGAIIISLRKNLAKTTAKLTNFYGIDLSVAALRIAQENAKKILGKDFAGKIKFLRGNLLQPLAKSLADSKQKILICANLPYLSKTELREPSIRREPRLALYGGKNSAAKIGALLRQISRLQLTQGPDQVKILLEIGHDQAGEVKKLAKKYLPRMSAKIFKDLSSFNRLVELEYTD